MADVVGKTHTGACFCGGVTYTATDLSDIWYCHCTQCQKMSGHHVAAAGTKRDQLSIIGSVTWDLVTENSSFGRCEKCHSLLFWQNKTQATISVLVGSLDAAVELDVKGHVFVAEKASYYCIADDLPQFAALPPNGVREQEQA